MFKPKYILFKIPLALWIGGAVIIVAVLGSAKQATAASDTCLNGTTKISESARREGREYEFCQPHGGYSNGDPTVCNDGTKISESARREGREADFCSGRLGYTVPASEPNQVEQPTFVKGDCEGDNINASAPVGSKDHCGILIYVTTFIKILSALVGVVVVAMIIIGGIQYSVSGGDPNAIGAAKKRIVNAILALALYSFMFALLQYLIPGGVLQL